MRGPLLSFALHLLLIAAVILMPRFAPIPDADKPPIADPPNRRIRLPPITTNAGGGGQRSPITAVAKGRLPRTSPRPFVAPTYQRPETPPMLAIEPAILGETSLSVRPDQIGILSGIAGAMGGTGKNGLGQGTGGGIGDDRGPGATYGHQESNTTGPVLVYSVEAQYSEEARKARFQGTVVLEAEIDTRGVVTQVRVRNSLGLGLDERAVAAVKQWRFRPAMRNRQPVAVTAVIEVNFRLL